MAINVVTRIGIFGGTFDPVHFGHLLLAESCREQLALDEVWWIPATVSPHKQAGSTTPGHHRMEMLRLATGGNSAFRVDSIELDRGGVSYTIDTLRQLAEKRPEATWFVLLGADSLQSLPTWHQPREILELATPAVVDRPGEPPIDYSVLAELVTPERLKQLESLRVVMPLVGYSSTDLRTRVHEGRSIRYQVPRAVEEYIGQHQLYRGEEE